ncbi:uroporphyrinogen-III C-methyltransferase [Gracilibacillus suaedae]|uniref:uroporphyrinogen-III C-methyltransferase n=1 Tax=Gracilibacillus suaedae TaxID=2820273 RepID=UPI001ABEE448|nr:uroporphyrinogen-III C-methyltransferase [Gracilibacillus suaedae]
MGKVFLIGAGPGDPDLITVKGLRTIQEADVILYDRLVNKQLLQNVKPEADLIFCGKFPSLHLKNQEMINQLLVKYGQEDKNVVRLKGGDPFVFGRGAEEAAVLAKNGVDYEVVPGITSGIAVPAYAGIPVTHREIGRSFAMITGHLNNEEINWKQLASSVDTIAVYMGVKNLPFIVEKLMEGGKSVNTPIAIIQEGTTENQKVIIGNLQTIVDLAEQDMIQNPAMIIVGEVVKIRKQLADWKEVQLRCV